MKYASARCTSLITLMARRVLFSASNFDIRATRTKNNYSIYIGKLEHTLYLIMIQENIKYMHS